MCKHYFDTAIAADVGINAAILYEHIKFWIQHNEKTGKNLKEGKTWMYNTQAELSEQFEYLSVKQVRTALAKLEAAGYIIKGNFNRSGYDRTCWYALGEKAPKEQEQTADQEVEEPVKIPEIVPVPEQPKTPHTAPASRGKSKYPYGRKQKPQRANPEPIWLFGNAPKAPAIPDIKNDLEKERYIKKMRDLAARCGAVCTV